MSKITWITPAGSLGAVPEGIYYQLALDAVDSGGHAITYTKISGTLPAGLQVARNGYLKGVPVVLNNNSTDKEYSYTFTVRADSGHGYISDRAFTVTVNNLVPPVIEPRITDLGQTFDGEVLNIDLDAYDNNPAATLRWSVVSGTIPAGTTLDATTGKLTGYLTPILAAGDLGFRGYDEARADAVPYDYNGRYISVNYKFTVEVTDGTGYDTLTYVLRVVSKQAYTADNVDILADNTYLDISYDNVYNPFITTTQTDLPIIRQDSFFAFKFDAIDPNGQEIRWTISTQDEYGFDPLTKGFDETNFDQSQQTLPPGLTIDPFTGWLTGHIGTQVEAEKVYTFNVQCYERDDPSRISNPLTVNLTVLGSTNNTIIWTTAADLGVIDNGTISELSVSAYSPLGKALTYSLVSNTSSLPQGLEVQSDGLISGRTSFRYFKLDNGTTTIDASIGTTFDNTHTFTIMAITDDGTASSTKQFSIVVNNYNTDPYENLYIKAFPSLDQRIFFEDIISNTDIFPDELIYRSTDPYWGKAADIKSLFLPGVRASSLSEYMAAMGNNHYQKRIEFGNIKTARAVDPLLNVKYEVVYVELLDPNVSSNDLNIFDKSIDLTNIISNPYLYDDSSYMTYYINSFGAMMNNIDVGLGFQHKGALPDWMTSPQDDGTVLGLVPAVVLAYTVPGASKLIAYRLQANGMEFNNIDFTLDRYELDNSLSSYYDTSADQFLSERETTFDFMPSIGTIEGGTVDYAVTQSFDSINGRTVEYIRANGGLDGVLAFAAGERLIFAKQENYSNDHGPYDGWVDVTDAYIGNDLTDTVIDGLFDSVNYDQYSIIPGYLDKLLGISTENRRAGIWEVAITDNVVTLNFVQEINLGSRVKVSSGRSYGSSYLIYDPVVGPTETVPNYSQFDAGPNNTRETRTRFDGDGTRFFSYRDIYQTPGTGDKYLKYPHNGAFV